MHRSSPGRHSPYVGRFAPTPSGPLHFGSLVTAMASWLDARSVEGLWLVRVEDLDTPRNVPGADRNILDTLACYGMLADKPVTWQSQNLAAYWRAIEQLSVRGLTYRCTCSRREIAEAGLASDGLPVYPGTCRDRSNQNDAAALRLRVKDEEVCFSDRRAGSICQNIAEKVGDFVLRRADGVVTYQLAVVVDDGAENITHVVRGADLIDSTPRQIYLQHCLGLPTPKYWHVPLAVNPQGEKLSKQTGALALEQNNVLPTLLAAAEHLGLTGLAANSIDHFWRAALVRFRDQQAAQPTRTAAAPDPMSEASEQIAQSIIASTHTIALVGASPSPMRDSHRIMAYLMRTGFNVLPVNPNTTEVLGQRAYAKLTDIDTPIDTVVCFRRSEEIEPIADAAIAIKAKNLWMQLGVVNPAAKRKAEAAGLQVVMDRCIMVDHRAWRIRGPG